MIGREVPKDAQGRDLEPGKLTSRVKAPACAASLTTSARVTRKVATTLLQVGSASIAADNLRAWLALPLSSCRRVSFRAVTSQRASLRRRPLRPPSSITFPLARHRHPRSIPAAAAAGVTAAARTGVVASPRGAEQAERVCGTRGRGVCRRAAGPTPRDRHADGRPARSCPASPPAPSPPSTRAARHDATPAVRANPDARGGSAAQARRQSGFERRGAQRAAAGVGAARQRRGDARRVPHAFHRPPRVRDDGAAAGA